MIWSDIRMMKRCVFHEVMSEVVVVMLLYSTGYFIEPTVIETKDPTHVLMCEVSFLSLRLTCHLILHTKLCLNVCYESSTKTKFSCAQKETETCVSQ